MFPKFLLPPSVFRSRQAAGQSSHKRKASESSPDTVVKGKYLDGHTSYLRCSRCAADLCLTSQIISKGFTGRHGRAYLVSAEPMASAVSVSPAASPTTSLPNTITQREVPRQLVTGAHTVSDLSCALCGSVLGWKYVAAEEESQRYKVGKFILESKRITTSSCWENTSSPSSSSSPDRSNLEEIEPEVPDDHVEFDSQDEDECEDLFAGIWSPDLATRRKSRKFDRRPSMFGFS